MGHLRLVHSVPGARAPAHPCLDVYKAELDYLHETFRRLGAPADEIEDFVHRVFLALHRTCPIDDGPRPRRPYLFGVAFRIVQEERRPSHAELHATFDASSVVAASRGSSRLVSALLDAGRVVHRQPETIRTRAIFRARAALASGEAFARSPRSVHRRRTVRAGIVVCLALAISATGAAVAFLGKGERDRPAPSQVLHHRPVLARRPAGPAPTSPPPPTQPLAAEAPMANPSYNRLQHQEGI